MYQIGFIWYSLYHFIKVIGMFEDFKTLAMFPGKIALWWSSMVILLYYTECLVSIECAAKVD